MTNPPRRWFQFKLSTWFVLVAIAAWGMLVYGNGPEPSALLARTSTIQCFDQPSPLRDFIEEQREEIALRPSLKWPALALAAFVSWKAAWAIRRRTAAR